MGVVEKALGAVERIGDRGRSLACIIHAEFQPDATEFVTPDDFTQQVGFVVHEAGQEIARHKHRPIDRCIVGTGEVLIVRKGRCEVDLYNESGALISTRELRTGDILILVCGGHGFRMLEDTVLLEVKQGPYTGLAEKEFF